MNRLILLFALLFAVAAPGFAAQNPGVLFYLQLVHGNDEATPPTPQCKPVGPKLGEKLGSVFKWRNYWELKRSSIVVRHGEKIRRTMSPEHEVEVELLDAEKVAIRIYSHGRLKRARVEPLHDAFCVAGGSRGANQAWFIVVRRDEPRDVRTRL